jgi:aspartate 1-decarboxylase
MGMIRLMHAKLHRVRVTEANVNYVGSITIDPELLNQVGILPLEEVDIINLNNGRRFSTYAIPGRAGSGEICPNGGAALLCQPGDLLIIYAYEALERREVLREGHEAKVFVAGEDGEAPKFYRQNLVPQGEALDFQSLEEFLPPWKAI